MTDTIAPADTSVEVTVPTATTTAAPAEPAAKPEVQTESAASTEPQNALTRKFTEEEWTALKEFRVRMVPCYDRYSANMACTSDQTARDMEGCICA